MLLSKNEILIWLKNWIRYPLVLGAVLPTQRFASNIMASEISSKISTVVELGAGTGQITKSIIDKKLKHENLFLVELNKIQDHGNLEKFISFMWDRGYKVGHSVRSINDIKKISKNDLKEFTSYLTRRAIISNQNIDNKITKALNGLWTRNNFYNQKFIVQQRRHSEFHSSAYNLEPDLKESPGTLRDFQSALWILQHCYGLDSQDAINKSGVIDGEFKKAIEAYNLQLTLLLKKIDLTLKLKLKFQNMQN